MSEEGGKDICRSSPLKNGINHPNRNVMRFFPLEVTPGPQKSGNLLNPDDAIRPDACCTLSFTEIMKPFFDRKEKRITSAPKAKVKGFSFLSSTLSL